VASSSDHVNERSGSIKGEEFVEQLRDNGFLMAHSAP
jgi:hypothetical protein